VDGKSDWLISIMKYFDWLQIHINNSFKNSSVKLNKQYFERALSKSLTKFGHTTLKEQQN
jgi:hypothetical protein